MPADLSDPEFLRALRRALIDIAREQQVHPNERFGTIIVRDPRGGYVLPGRPQTQVWERGGFRDRQEGHTRSIGEFDPVAVVLSSGRYHPPPAPRDIARMQRYAVRFGTTYYYRHRGEIYVITGDGDSYRVSVTDVFGSP
jgi:hypothetical protein